MDRPIPAKARARRAGALLFTAALASTLAAGCMEGRGGQDPNQPQQAYDPNNPYAQPQAPYGQAPYGQAPYPQQGYPPPQGQYPQQGYPAPQPTPGYGAPPPGQYPQGAPAATAPASPLALPCQNDLICGFHKCNLTTQRCAFPCTANTDCASGFACVGAGGPTAICAPGAGQ